MYCRYLLMSQIYLVGAVVHEIILYGVCLVLLFNSVSVKNLGFTFMQMRHTEFKVSDCFLACSSYWHIFSLVCRCRWCAWGHNNGKECVAGGATWLWQDSAGASCGLRGRSHPDGPDRHQHSGPLPRQGRPQHAHSPCHEGKTQISLYVHVWRPWTRISGRWLWQVEMMIVLLKRKTIYVVV